MISLINDDVIIENYILTLINSKKLEDARKLNHYLDEVEKNSEIGLKHEVKEWNHSALN